jgi:6-phosphogluconolactonase
MDLRIHKDLEGLSLEAAQIFFELVRKKEENGPPFTVALSGGSTPRTLYRILASEPYGKKISWGGVQLFFGDERCVEPKHPDSNYRMVFDTLVSRVDIPGENIHRMEGELEPASAAARYEEYLKKFFGERGLVDEATEENFVESLLSWRLTLTFPVVNAASTVVFLVSGEAKAKVLKELVTGARGSAPYPAGRVRPVTGRLIWLVDKEAARLLCERK